MGCQDNAPGQVMTVMTPHHVTTDHGPGAHTDTEQAGKIWTWEYGSGDGRLCVRHSHQLSGHHRLQGHEDGS